MKNHVVNCLLLQPALATQWATSLIEWHTAATENGTTVKFVVCACLLMQKKQKILFSGILKAKHAIHLGNTSEIGRRR
jgi:hypothetical protein